MDLEYGPTQNRSSLQYYAALDRTAAGDPFVPGMLVLLGIFLAGAVLGTVVLHRKDFS